MSATTAGVAAESGNADDPLRPGLDDVAYNGLAEIGIRHGRKAALSAPITAFSSLRPPRAWRFSSSPPVRQNTGSRNRGAHSASGTRERGSIDSVPAPCHRGHCPSFSDGCAARAIAGYYANYKSVMRSCAARPHPDALPIRERAWKDADDAARLKMRSDGTFSSDAKPLMAYRAAESEVCAISCSARPTGRPLPHRMAYGQRIEPKAAVSAAWQHGWASGGWPSTRMRSHLAGAAAGRFRACRVPELPGYVLNSVQITDATAATRLPRCV